MDNAKLKEKYEEMHEKGPEAWFDDGSLEREAIIKAGGNWAGVKVLEIGCGEGDLCKMIDGLGATVLGVDYSETAIKNAMVKYPCIKFKIAKYQEVKGTFQRVILMGVLEHLDKPWDELEWILDHLVEDYGEVIISCPNFVNPRGIVWMALRLVGAVMSKTDLHHLNPWDFEKFCAGKFKLEQSSIDVQWAYGEKMIRDLEKRIPLAVQDGRLKIKDLKSFMKWIDHCAHDMPASAMNGAVAIYKITK